MRITPLDIRNHRFPRQMGGYDREEVDTFLRMVAEDYEAVLRDAQASAIRSSSSRRASRSSPPTRRSCSRR